MRPLRVVILSTYFHPVIGGVETHTRQLARGLKACGLDVWILTKRITRDMPARDVVDGVPVRRVPPLGPRTSMAKWRFVPWATSALVRERARFDVILCIDYRGIGLAALAAGRMVNKPVVFDAETPGALSCGNWDPALNRAGLRWLASLVKRPVQSLYARADAYACISREIEREALDRGIARDRVWYLPHTVDTQTFRPPTDLERAAARQAVGVTDDRQIVMFVGRVSREKGILDLVAAWRTLKRQNAVLLVVGPEMPGHPLDAGPEVRRAAADLGSGRIRLHGPTSDVRSLLAAADLFVQPSHYEAFGLSAIEAMGTARPMVATRVGALAEYLRDGENALLCEPHDPDGLGSCIARVLDDPLLSARLAARARTTVEEQFDEKQVTRRWVDCLGSLRSNGVRSAIRAVPAIALFGSSAQSVVSSLMDALTFI